MIPARSLVPALAAAALAVPAFGANWTSPTDGDWKDAANWDINDYPMGGEDDNGGSPDTAAVFGDVAGAGAAINVSIGSYRYPGVTSVTFSSTSIAYTLSRNGRGFTNTQDFTVTADVTQDQTIVPYVGTYRGANITNNSTDATLYFGGVTNTTSSFAQYDVNIGGDGDVVVNGDIATTGRILSLNKSGGGAYSHNGVFDFKIGDNGGDFEQAVLVVTGGVLDISGTTLNLETIASNDPLDAADLTSGESYIVVDYTAVGAPGLVTGGSPGQFFASVNGLPTGWQLADTGSQIVLAEVPEPASLALVLAGAACTMLRPGRRSA